MWIETTTTFANYDQGKHVANLLAAFPFLPNVTFHVNNYRTKIVRYRGGQEISRETYTYAYNSGGKPTQRTLLGVRHRLRTHIDQLKSRHAIMDIPAQLQRIGYAGQPAVCYADLHLCPRPGG